jgi:hypothetical protein
LFDGEGLEVGFVLLGDELFYFVRFCRRGEEGADLFFCYLHVFQQLS